MCFSYFQMARDHQEYDTETVSFLGDENEEQTSSQCNTIIVLINCAGVFCILFFIILLLVGAVTFETFEGFSTEDYCPISHRAYERCYYSHVYSIM